MQNGEFELLPGNSAGEEKTAAKKNGKPYVFYCIMTLSVMLFTLAFAASELFSMFFSTGYPGGIIMSRLFGATASDGKKLEEILLGQSFMDLSFMSSVSSGDLSEVTRAPEDVIIPPSETSETVVDATSDDPSVTDEVAPPERPAGMKDIISMDLSLLDYGNDYISNQSGVTPDLGQLKMYDFSTDLSSVYPENAPVVLILHTHGTEAFTDDGIDYYDPEKETARSDDLGKNVVSLGKRLAGKLCSVGINAVCCETMHDLESYSGAYTRAGDTIAYYLEKYPTIQYVIDLHRDAVVKSTGELVKPLSPDGETAQLMFVVGQGAGRWEGNLALAQALRRRLNGVLPGVCRPTCLRSSSYNQQYACHSILVEVGAAGNTLGEAERAVDLFAEILCNVISGK